MTTVTLVGRSGCHLCEVAHEVVDHVLEGMPGDVVDRIDIVDVSIEDDSALHDLWWEKIPVVLIDGHFHSQWRIAPDRLRAALLVADSTSEETS